MKTWLVLIEHTTVEHFHIQAPNHTGAVALAERMFEEDDFRIPVNSERLEDELRLEEITEVK